MKENHKHRTGLCRCILFLCWHCLWQQAYLLRCRKFRYSASVIKPFVMASTFDQIKKGNLKYNSTVKDKYTKTGCHHTLHPASSASVGDGQSNITKRLWYSSGTYLQRNLCIIKILKRDAEAPACSDKKMEDTVRHSIRNQSCKQNRWNFQCWAWYGNRIWKEKRLHNLCIFKYRQWGLCASAYP